MKYAREVMELMGAYPGREFCMKEIVNSIAGKKASLGERTKVKKGVFRVFQQLKTVGTIAILEQKRNGSAARYVWKA